MSNPETIGHVTNKMMTKTELIQAINGAFPSDTGYVATVTTIVNTDYSTKNADGSFPTVKHQSVLFNGNLNL